ncbi:MAG TPA: ATP-binding protein, partial [Candidatus Binataceae bacterium]|nr:ATP-binding protein [Candidatus Binataceae bacterium]
DRHTVLAGIDKAVRNKSGFELEHRVRRADGTFAWVVSRTIPLLSDDGEIAEWFGTATDITDHKRSDALLTGESLVLEMIAQDAALTDTLGELIRVIEEQSEGLFCSILIRQRDADQHSIGIAPSLPDNCIRMLEHERFSPPYVGPCGMAVHLCQTVISDDIATDQRWSEEWRELALHNDFHTCYSSPILSSDGRAVGCFGMYYGRECNANPFSRQLIEAATHLAGIAIERKMAEDALREADRHKDEFLAMLAHELRNPLAAIGNATELLARVPSSAPQGQETIGLLKRQIRQFSRLVDDLLDVARISHGRIELRPAAIDLATIVAQAIEGVQPLVRQRRHRLLVESPDPSFTVYGDPTRLVQCVANLLNNAAKYTPDGGQILLRAGKEDGYAKIEIEDSGIGIQPDFLPHVFDLFAQNQRSLDRSEGGLGVGLSLVKQLVQMHGGTVEAISPGPGCGSTFTLRLPLVDWTTVDGSSAFPPSGTIRRVLIVDDNRDAADSLAMLLALDHHEVETVYSASDAIDAAASFHPDVVLLDIGLPQINGYEVARRMRQITELSSTRLIALTGYGQADDKRRAQEAGFDGHLIKPVPLDELKRVLTNVQEKNPS